MDLPGSQPGSHQIPAQIHPGSSREQILQGWGRAAAAEGSHRIEWDPVRIQPGLNPDPPGIQPRLQRGFQPGSQLHPRALPGLLSQHLLKLPRLPLSTRSLLDPPGPSGICQIPHRSSQPLLDLPDITWLLPVPPGSPRSHLDLLIPSSSTRALLAPPDPTWILQTSAGSSRLHSAPPGPTRILLTPPGSPRSHPAAPDPSWILQIPHRCSWCLVAPPDPTWTLEIPPGSTRLHQDPPDPAWILRTPPGTTRRLVAPPDPSWISKIPSGFFRLYQDPPDPSWMLQIPPGSSDLHLDPRDPSWLLQTPLDPAGSLSWIPLVVPRQRGRDWTPQDPRTVRLSVPAGPPDARLPRIPPDPRSPGMDSVRDSRRSHWGQELWWPRVLPWWPRPDEPKCLGDLWGHLGTFGDTEGTFRDVPMGSGVAPWVMSPRSWSPHRDVPMVTLVMVTS